METTVSSSLGGNQGVWGDIPVLKSIDPIDFSENMNGIYITPNVVNLISKSTCVEFLIERANNFMKNNMENVPGGFVIITCTEPDPNKHSISPFLELYGLDERKQYVRKMKQILPSKTLTTGEQEIKKEQQETSKQTHTILNSDPIYQS